MVLIFHKVPANPSGAILSSSSSSLICSLEDSSDPSPLILFKKSWTAKLMTWFKHDIWCSSGLQIKSYSVLRYWLIYFIISMLLEALSVVMQNSFWIISYRSRILTTSSPRRAPVWWPDICLKSSKASWRLQSAEIQWQVTATADQLLLVKHDIRMNP